jgi:hypothetical protein
MFRALVRWCRQAKKFTCAAERRVRVQAADGRSDVSKKLTQCHEVRIAYHRAILADTHDDLQNDGADALAGVQASSGPLPSSVARIWELAAPP